MPKSGADKKRVAIVTGAGKGIGRACAIELARNGVIVIVNNRCHANDLEYSADTVVDEIIKFGGQAVADYQSIENADTGINLVDLAIDQFGRLDAVISNAGISLNKKAEATSEKQLREIMEINFFAAVALSQAALPTLKNSSSGRLIHCISSAGLYGGYGMGAYAASKSALWGYLKSCALEYEKYGVCINALAPFADTQMTDGFMSNEVRQQLTAEAIAPVLAWLASENCNITGETLITAGGRLRVAGVNETETVFLTDHQDIESAANKALQTRPSLTFKSGIDSFVDICNSEKSLTNT